MINNLAINYRSLARMLFPDGHDRVVLESEHCSGSCQEPECVALEEERKRTMEIEDLLAFLELEVESFARWSDTAVPLEERTRALVGKLEDVAAEASGCLRRRKWRLRHVRQSA